MEIKGLKCDFCGAVSLNPHQEGWQKSRHHDYYYEPIKGDWDFGNGARHRCGVCNRFDDLKKNQEMISKMIDRLEGLAAMIAQASGSSVEDIKQDSEP